MNRKITKIIIISVAIIAVAILGIGLYKKFNQGPIVGRIEFGAKYVLTSIRPTERFAGAEYDSASYFKIDENKQTGTLYLKGLTATPAPIPFIVTSYQEGTKETVIEFEYIIGNGEDTVIEKLRAISTRNKIVIKTVEPHGIQDVITQNPGEIDKLEYNVTILEFSREVA